jgi:hypothetical protein
MTSRGWPDTSARAIALRVDGTFSRSYAALKTSHVRRARLTFTSTSSVTVTGLFVVQPSAIAHSNRSNRRERIACAVRAIDLRRGFRPSAMIFVVTLSIGRPRLSLKTVRIFLTIDR